MISQYDTCRYRALVNIAHIPKEISALPLAARRMREEEWRQPRYRGKLSPLI